MLDLKFIRSNLDRIKAATLAKGYDLDWDKFLQVDKQRRLLQTQIDRLRKEKKEISKRIGQARFIEGSEDNLEQLKKIANQLTQEIKDLEVSYKTLDKELFEFLIRIPNVAHESVPIGSAEHNVVIRQWGNPKEVDFEVKPHWDIAEDLGIMNFALSSKITGSNFALFIGLGAKLERALFSFMLDLHTGKHGYKEVFPPFLVNRASMFGTGQLPNLEEDMYKLRDDDLFLIPTAEVPVTNLHRDEVLREEDLPIYYTAYTACFRREAGSYGRETKGLLRVHQFDKVELVKFVLPESSYEEHEKLLADAEEVLQLLNIPYRVVLLASGDLSFAAAKCYDIEIWAPGVRKWLEVSSCSNFEDFQARRANIRFKRKNSKNTEFVHTLNGSGVALARLMAVILEQYQNPDGSVEIPKVLRDYMGLDKITK